VASVITIRRKKREGTTADGKPIWKQAKGFLYYGKIKNLDGEWIQVPTHQPSKTLALKWAANECACDKCGGPDRIRRRREEEAAKATAVAKAQQRKLCGELIDEWLGTLSNASAADDRSRMNNHIRPAFAAMAPADIDLATVMKWIDKLRATAVPPASKPGRGRRRVSATGKLTDATVRHALNLLSRFVGWCVTRGYAPFNPVRLIPTGERPKQSPKRSDMPWINDDKTVRDLMNALAPPFREMFYLGNRCGLRPCETRGLRMSDLDHVGEGYIRARYSDDRSFLKEDKAKEGKSKWVPAPDDIAAVMGPFLAQRQTEGAQPEDHVFMPEVTRCALEQRMLAAFNEAADSLGLDIKQYEATRHSMISRNLDAGVPIDEVSKAVGHTTPATTQRHYNHIIRPRYASPLLRAGLGIVANADDATVVQLRKKAKG
jgi:integrase